MSDVYDSAFSGVGVARSFAESTVFKVLHRRMLGLRLAVSGQFRCKFKLDGNGELMELWHENQSYQKLTDQIIISNRRFVT